MKLLAGLGAVVLLLTTSVVAGSLLMSADESIDDRSQASDSGISSTSLSLSQVGAIPNSLEMADYGLILKTDPATITVKTVRFDIALPASMVVSDANEQNNGVT